MSPATSHPRLWWASYIYIYIYTCFYHAHTRDSLGWSAVPSFWPLERREHCVGASEEVLFQGCLGFGFVAAVCAPTTKACARSQFNCNYQYQSVSGPLEVQGIQNQNPAFLLSRNEGMKNVETAIIGCIGNTTWIHSCIPSYQG